MLEHRWKSFNYRQTNDSMQTTIDDGDNKMCSKIETMMTKTSFSIHISTFIFSDLQQYTEDDGKNNWETTFLESRHNKICFLKLKAPKTYINDAFQISLHT